MLVTTKAESSDRLTNMVWTVDNNKTHSRVDFSSESRSCLTDALAQLATLEQTQVEIWVNLQKFKDPHPNKQERFHRMLIHHRAFLALLQFSTVIVNQIHR